MASAIEGLGTHEMLVNKFNAALAAAFLSCSIAAPSSAAQAPPIKAYGALPAIEEAKPSPSGAYTAMLMIINNERQILIQDRGGVPVKQLMIGDAKVRGIDWIGDEAILLRRSETDQVAWKYGTTKSEWARANVIPLDDRREVVSVFANQNYIANFVAGFYGIRQVEGSWFGYFGGLGMGKQSGEDARILHYSPALYSVNLRTGETDQIAFPANEDQFRDWLVGPDGAVAATLDVDTEKGRWKIENSRGDAIARGEQRGGKINLVGFDSAGAALIYSEYDRDLKNTRYYQVALAGGVPVELWANVELQSIMFGRNSRVLGAVTTSGDIVMNEATHSKAIEGAYAMYPNSVAKLTGWTPDLSSIIMNTSGNYDSGTWYRLDTTTGARSMLGLERAYIQGQAIGAIQTFRYQAQDGLSIDAILTLPPGREPKGLPVVVMPHGGPTAHDEPVFDWWAQAFASRGYAVLQPNFRGSTDKGEEFRRAGDGEWGRKMQTDLSDGLAALDQAGIGDAKRACIVGASYGGYAALAGVTMQDGIYRCAVGVNGVYDLDLFFRHFFTGRTDIFERGAEQLLGENADRKQLSPTRHARSANAPVLLIHGKDDTVVPYAQSVLMEDALKDAKKPVKLIALKGEDHWLSQADTRTDMLEAAIGFVQKHNPAD